MLRGYLAAGGERRLGRGATPEGVGSKGTVEARFELGSGWRVLRH